jgi:nucleotide-binding universal stress UspA family protein
MGAVVVEIDSAGESQAALETPIEEALRPDSSLLVVHNVPLAGSSDSLTEWQRHGEALLARAGQQATEEGVNARPVLDVGSQSAADVILRAALVSDVEPVVIGARRRTRVGKRLTGSDVQRVSMGAKVPVRCVTDLHGRLGIIAP